MCICCCRRCCGRGGRAIKMMKAPERNYRMPRGVMAVLATWVVATASVTCGGGGAAMGGSDIGNFGRCLSRQRK
ncbi:hypothetical protein F0562_015949 [Nyssa sinensis]|uniref:Uncharacterized protein n=1 Tax=Nyssa sinensis TaxID=561372 RepID=A0A5J4ZIQ3_9ASTE|nr:hypothetical protein F0562_015949 [Nyssa sinensis]